METTKTQTDLTLEQKAIAAGNAPQVARTYDSKDGCPYRVVVEPVGGKLNAPANAMFVLVHDQYREDGTVKATTERGTLRDADGRLFSCSWGAAARKDTTKKRGEIDDRIALQWGNYFDALLPDNVRRPIAVRALVARVQATMPTCDDMEFIAQNARYQDPALAAYIEDDGTYRPPAPFDTMKRPELVAFCKDNDIAIEKGLKVDAIRALCKMAA
jgi:hypothetical protein